jgi:hypothetical protein
VAARPELAQTKAEADANPVYPGGTFRVYGDFCWGGEKSRAEAYFVPAGTRPDPNVNKNDPEVAKKAMQTLIAQNMRGGAVEASDTFVTFQVPDDDKILEGNGDAHGGAPRRVRQRGEARERLRREDRPHAQGPARSPLNLPLVLGIVGGVVVVILLVVVLARGGGPAAARRAGGRLLRPAAGTVAAPLLRWRRVRRSRLLTVAGTELLRTAERRPVAGTAAAAPPAWL